MKKIAILGLALLTCGAAFAQVANVKKAKAKLFGEEVDIQGARELILPALTDEASSKVADTWQVAAAIEKKVIDTQLQNRYLGGTFDAEAAGKAAVNAVKYYYKEDEIGQLPNAKGKVNPKYRKDAINGLSFIYASNELLPSYAIDLYNEKKYEASYEVFNMWLGIRESEAIKSDAKTLSKMPIDSTHAGNKSNAAMCAMKAGRYDDAVRLYKELEDDKEPIDRSEIVNGRCAIYVAKGDTAGYIEALTAGMVEFPQDTRFLHSLIDIYFTQGRTNKGLELLDKAIEGDPNSANLRYVQCINLLKLKRYDDAAAAAQKAIELDGSKADYKVYLGEIYYQQAEDMWNRSMNINDDKAYAKAQADAKVVYRKAFDAFAQVQDDDYASKRYNMLKNRFKFK